jgi:hypothetical protein
MSSKDCFIKVYYLLQQRQNQIKFKQNEPDKISNSLLSKLIINLSKLLGAV